MKMCFHFDAWNDKLLFYDQNNIFFANKLITKSIRTHNSASHFNQHEMMNGTQIGWNWKKKKKLISKIDCVKLESYYVYCAINKAMKLLIWRC